MTTLFNFQPSATAPYQFQPTLDGELYTATIPWLLFGQRWYMELADENGNRVFTMPLIASAVGESIAAAAWDFDSQQVTITTLDPHGYPIGTTVDLTISGMVPTAFNGTFQCFVIDQSDVVYDLSTNPGMATSFGSLSYDINMATGFFQTSTLIWRQANNQFEVSP